MEQEEDSKIGHIGSAGSSSLAGDPEIAMEQETGEQEAGGPESVMEQEDGGSSSSVSDGAAGEPEVPADTTSTDGEKKLTKRQLRRLKKQEKWLQWKPEKRKIERERKKARKREAREAGAEQSVSRKRMKQNLMANSDCQVSVVVDCSFDHLMEDRDICRLGQQIQYCYSSNRRAENPLQFYVTSVGSKTKTRLDAIGDYGGWDVHFKEAAYDEFFDKDKLVYLSAESPNILPQLENDKAYIIGGLVDHNRHKGLCLKLAEEKGIAHAQLPIGEYMQLKTRKVLTVNHVFDILLRVTETKDWEQAFFSVIPKRKGLSTLNKDETTDTQKETFGCETIVAKGATGNNDKNQDGNVDQADSGDSCHQQVIDSKDDISRTESSRTVTEVSEKDSPVVAQNDNEKVSSHTTDNNSALKCTDSQNETGGTLDINCKSNKCENATISS